MVLRKLKKQNKQRSKRNKTQLPILANHEKKNITRLSEGSNLSFEIGTSKGCWLYIDNSLLVFWVKHLVLKCAPGRLRLEHKHCSQSVLLKFYLYLSI